MRGPPTRHPQILLRGHVLADEESMAGDERPYSSSERAALRARAEQVRNRARALTAQALVLSANAQRQFRDADAHMNVAKELRDRLRDVTARQARLARALEEPPEHAVLRVKETATEAIAIAKVKVGTIDPVEAQLLREQLVRWTVDAYFSATPLSS